MFYLKTQFILHSKHSSSQPYKPLLYRTKGTVYSETHTKDMNALGGQNIEAVNVNTGGMYSNS